jgi:hypothetical protein
MHDTAPFNYNFMASIFFLLQAEDSVFMTPKSSPAYSNDGKHGQACMFLKSSLFSWGVEERRGCIEEKHPKHPLSTAFFRKYCWASYLNNVIVRSKL